MPESPENDRSAETRGLVWAAQITTLGLQLVLPILAGYWLDQRWQTDPWLLLLGALLGISIFSVSIVRLSQVASKKS